MVELCALFSIGFASVFLHIIFYPLIFFYKKQGDISQSLTNIADTSTSFMIFFFLSFWITFESFNRVLLFWYMSLVVESYEVFALEGWQHQITAINFHLKRLCTHKPWLIISFWFYVFHNKIIIIFTGNEVKSLV